MAKLTKRTVDAAKPRGRDHFMWDDDLPGFGVRVFASGKKSYLVQYRASGRTRRYTIGLHGKFTPDEARKRAAGLLAEVADGGDPSGERAEARKAMTVAEVADLYLSEGPAEKPNKKASSWKADESNIRRHILPLLGRRLAKSLTQADVARFQSDVAAGRTAADEKTGFRGRAIVKGGKGTAARSLAVLAAMLQFGVGRGLLPSNPGRGVKPYKGEKKERFLSEAEEPPLPIQIELQEARAPFGLERRVQRSGSRSAVFPENAPGEVRRVGSHLQLDPDALAAPRGAGHGLPEHQARGEGDGHRVVLVKGHGPRGRAAVAAQRDRGPRPG